MNIGQLDGQPLALQIFNGMTAESTCVNERWAKDQLFRCVCFAGGRHQTILDDISIHVLRVEDDRWTRQPERHASGFQSTSSVRRTTLGRQHDYALVYISIHVLRVEDDRAKLFFVLPALQFQSTSSVWRTTLSAGGRAGPHHDFNPRPPCGGRLKLCQVGPLVA